MTFFFVVCDYFFEDEQARNSTTLCHNNKKMQTTLNVDVLQTICEFLHFTNMPSVMRTCKTWYAALATHTPLWQNFYNRQVEYFSKLIKDEQQFRKNRTNTTLTRRTTTVNLPLHCFPQVVLSYVEKILNKKQIQNNNSSNGNDNVTNINNKKFGQKKKPQEVFTPTLLHIVKFSRRFFMTFLPHFIRKVTVNSAILAAYNTNSEIYYDVLNTNFYGTFLCDLFPQFLALYPSSSSSSSASSSSSTSYNRDEEPIDIVLDRLFSQVQVGNYPTSIMMNVLVCSYYKHVQQMKYNSSKQDDTNIVEKTKDLAELVFKIVEKFSTLISSKLNNSNNISNNWYSSMIHYHKGTTTLGSLNDDNSSRWGTTVWRTCLLLGNEKLCKWAMLQAAKEIKEYKKSKELEETTLNSKQNEKLKQDKSSTKMKQNADDQETKKKVSLHLFDMKLVQHLLYQINNRNLGYKSNDYSHAHLFRELLLCAVNEQQEQGISFSSSLLEYHLVNEKKKQAEPHNYWSLLESMVYGSLQFNYNEFIKVMTAIAKHVPQVITDAFATVNEKQEDSGNSNKNKNNKAISQRNALIMYKWLHYKISTEHLELFLNWMFNKQKNNTVEAEQQQEQQIAKEDQADDQQIQQVFAQVQCVFDKDAIGALKKTYGTQFHEIHERNKQWWCKVPGYKECFPNFASSKKK